MSKSDATQELKAGDRAPAFKMPSDGGGQISSATLKGTPYVLYFYPKDDTSGCTKEAIAFSAAKKRFDALGVTVIGVSKDSVASHDRFKTKHKLTITLASDPETAAAAAYGTWVEKSLYGRKYMGTERTTFLIGADGKIVRVWRKVKVPGHVEEVLAAAKAL
jgi:peroxiredoxin Q/BCP